MINWPVEILDNKYKKWYEQIVLTAQTRTLPDNTYFEKHHIIPQSIGGSNKKINLAILTAREHFICHRLLTRFLTGKAKMKMAFATWIMMTNNNPHQTRYKVTSRVYEIVKKEMVAVQRTKEHRKKISEGIKKSPNRKPVWNKGKTGIYSEETREKMRQGALKPRSPETKTQAAIKALATKEKNGTLRKPGMWSPSLEAREKLRQANLGKKVSEETRKKISIAGKGRVISSEIREKISKAHQGVKLSPMHLANLQNAQEKRRQRELEEKIRTAFVGPIKPVTAIEYRGVWYKSINRAGKAHGISREMIKRQINAFGNSPLLEICVAIDNKTIKWPRNSVMSEETKRKISQAQIGKFVSDETRKKQSEKALGRVPWNKGKRTKFLVS